MIGGIWGYRGVIWGARDGEWGRLQMVAEAGADVVLLVGIGGDIGGDMALWGDIGGYRGL